MNNNSGDAEVQSANNVHSAQGKMECCDPQELSRADAINTKRKRNEDEDVNATFLNDSSTIDDIANIDASTYIAWVNRQSQALPSVLVADQTETHVKLNATQHEDPIDGSAATLQVLLSKQMIIHPPPSVRHLPPIKHHGENTSLGHTPSDETKHSCSEWITTTVSNFSELRSQIEKAQSQMSIQHRKIAVPRMKDRAAWHVFCLGKHEASGNVGGYFQDSDDDHDDDNESGEEDTDEAGAAKLEEPKELIEVDPNIYNPQLVPPNGYRPSLSLLLQFDQVLTRFLFHHHIHFFCEWKSPLTRNRAAWIYALLARMEKPWHREECSAVRRLLRECCARRHRLILPDGESTSDLADGIDVESKQSTSDTKSSLEQDRDTKVWEQLALLNTLIAVTGIYYEQGSMAGGDGMHALFTVPS
jgi:survival of motor neuron protein-interacting protein 1